MAGAKQDYIQRMVEYFEKQAANPPPGSNVEYFEHMADWYRDQINAPPPAPVEFRC